MTPSSLLTRRHALLGAAGSILAPSVAARAAGARGVSDTEIVIGTMTDLSGVTAVQGTNNANAMRLAFDEANARGASTVARSGGSWRTTSTWSPRRCRR
jgi:hypothetical protein